MKMKSSMKKIYSDKQFEDNSLTVMQMIAEYQMSTKSSLALSVEKISKRLKFLFPN